MSRSASEMFPATPDIFDQWASATPAPEAAPTPTNTPPEPTPETAATPLALRRAVQELLKMGLLEQAAKPLLFRQITSATARVDALLEPLDLRVQVDDLRGHGVVSEVDGSERLLIRPMIVHLANPENLQALLQQLREASAATPEGSA